MLIVNEHGEFVQHDDAEERRRAVYSRLNRRDPWEEWEDETPSYEGVCRNCGKSFRSERPRRYCCDTCRAMASEKRRLERRRR